MAGGEFECRGLGRGFGLRQFENPAALVDSHRFRLCQLPAVGSGWWRIVSGHTRATEMPANAPMLLPLREWPALRVRRTIVLHR